MSRRPRAFVVGISGPDGAGKSSLVHALASDAASTGMPFSEAYLYGCFLCRRRSTPVAFATVPAEMDRLPHVLAAASVAALRGHALLDALELGLALTRAERRVSRTVPAARDLGDGAAGPAAAPPLVVTDRSPLDGLVKHQPEIGSWVSHAFLRSARRYSLIVLLDAPAGVLARRDREHSAAELELARRQFLEWHERLPNAVRVDATGANAVVAERVRTLIETRRGQIGEAVTARLRISSDASDTRA